MMKNKQLPVERILELFSYDPEDGLLSWRVPHGRWGRIPPGPVKGSENGKGYLVIRIDGKNYLYHRVAWVCKTNRWPVDEIDHIDMNGMNNRWVNLREADHSQNMCNRKAQSNGATGVKGVSFQGSRGKYLAQVVKGGRHYFLGRYDSKDEAREVVEKATQEVHGKFARAA